MRRQITHEQLKASFSSLVLVLGSIVHKCDYFYVLLSHHHKIVHV